MRKAIETLREKKEELQALFIKDSLLRRQFQKGESTLKIDPESHLDDIQEFAESIAILEDVLLEKDTAKSELKKLKKEVEKRLARVIETPAIQEVRKKDKQRREQLTLENLAKEIEEMDFVLKLPEHRSWLVEHCIKKRDYKSLEEVHDCYTRMQHHRLASYLGADYSPKVEIEIDESEKQRIANRIAEVVAKTTEKKIERDKEERQAHSLAIPPEITFSDSFKGSGVESVDGMVKELVEENNKLREKALEAVEGVKTTTENPGDEILGNLIKEKNKKEGEEKEQEIDSEKERLAYRIAAYEHAKGVWYADVRGIKHPAVEHPYQEPKDKEIIDSPDFGEFLEKARGLVWHERTRPKENN